MKNRYAFLLFLSAFILQTTIMNHFRIFLMSPNLILCLVVIFSFLYNGYQGIVLGLVFGFITDICFAQIIGVAPACYFAVALICIEAKRYLYRDSMISVAIVTAAGTAVYALGFWSVYSMLGFNSDFVYFMEKEAVLLIYHIVIALAFYQVVCRSIFRHRSDRYMYRGNLQEARSLNRS